MSLGTRFADLQYGVGRHLYERPADRLMEDIVYVEVEPARRGKGME